MSEPSARCAGFLGAALRSACCNRFPISPPGVIAALTGVQCFFLRGGPVCTRLAKAELPSPQRQLFLFPAVLAACCPSASLTVGVLTIFTAGGITDVGSGYASPPPAVLLLCYHAGVGTASMITSISAARSTARKKTMGYHLLSEATCPMVLFCFEAVPSFSL